MSSAIQPGLGHEPLLVRAHLASGVALDARWGIALDGLLAAVMWRADKTAKRERGEPTPTLEDQAEPADLPLPLARCATDSGRWHWAATCAWPGTLTDDHLDVRWWAGRLDHRHLEQVVPRLPKHLPSHQGRYRTRRMPLITIACATLTWRAVGDLEQIRDLLGDVNAIGRKRVQGEGHVLRWEFAPDPRADQFDAAHLHPDGTLGRPTPAECLTGRADISTGGDGRTGLRPPYIHPSRQASLVLPVPLINEDEEPDG